jgi:hypothetical protein
VSGARLPVRLDNSSCNKQPVMLVVSFVAGRTIITLASGLTIGLILFSLLFFYLRSNYSI